MTLEALGFLQVEEQLPPPFRIAGASHARLSQSFVLDLATLPPKPQMKFDGGRRSTYLDEQAIIPLGQGANKAVGIDLKTPASIAAIDRFPI